MKNLFKKGILAGLGLGLLAKDKAEAAAKKLSEEAKLSEGEARELIDEVRNQAEKSRTAIEERVSSQVKETVRTMGLVTQDDLKKIEKKLDDLQSAVGKRQQKKSAGASKKQQNSSETKT